MKRGSQYFARLSKWVGEHSLGDLIHFHALFFPCSVIVLVSTALLFHQRCAPWQWYVAILISWGASIRKYGRSNAVSSLFVLSLMIGSMTLLTRISWCNSYCDYNWAHVPCTRMLILGWNPVYEDTQELLEKSVGISVSTFKWVYVILMAKAVPYFNAAAYFFVGENFNLMFPSVFFLALGTITCIWRATKEYDFTVKLPVVLYLLWKLPQVNASIDFSSMCGGVSFLLLAWTYLRTTQIDCLGLITMSVWFCTAKHTGVAPCLVFWMLLLTWTRLRFQMNFKKLFCVFCGVVALIGVVSFSPMKTIFLRQGIIEANKSANFDFYKRNSDAKSMGHLGLWLNSYVSPRLTNAYYAWKLGNPQFHPTASTWEQGGDLKVGSPTRLQYRVEFQMLLACLVLLGGVSAWLFVLTGLVATMLIPTEMIGYTRYISWMLAFKIILLLLILARLGRFGRRMILCCSFLLSVPLLLWTAAMFESSRCVREYLSGDCSSKIYIDWPRYRGNLLLLQKMYPKFSAREIVEIDRKENEKNKMYVNMLNDEIFMLPREADLSKRSRYFGDVICRCWKEKLFLYPYWIAKGWLVTFPSLAWRAIFKYD